MEPFGPDFRFREAPPAFSDYQRFILEHYDAEEVPISAFSHSLDRMLRFNCFHSVDNRPRRSMDDFVFTAYLLPRTPRNEELYERPWNGKKPHYVVLEQLLGVVDTSCAKLSLLMHIAMGITREDFESKSARYKIYLRSVEALEKGEY